MKVSFERTETFDEIFADEDFRKLRERFEAELVVRQFVTTVISLFRERAVGPDSFQRYGSFWAGQHRTSDPRTVELVEEVAPLLDSLWSTWARHLNRLRGALVEGLVLSRLQPRYGQNQLVDNAVVTVEDGINYTTPTTIDVTGWDGNRGECHDCKARAGRVDLQLIRSLETNLPQPEFRVGVVTTDSRPVMVQDLKGRGYSPAAITTLVPLEDLWELAPLQQTARH